MKLCYCSKCNILLEDKNPIPIQKLINYNMWVMKPDSTYSVIYHKNWSEIITYACPKCESDFHLDGNADQIERMLQSMWECNEFFWYDYRDDVTNIKMLMLIDGNEYNDWDIIDIIDYYLNESYDYWERGAMNRTLQNFEIKLPFSFITKL